MAKHEIIIRENTGTTKTEAPYLPQYVKKNDLAFAAVCSQVAAESGLTETQVRAIFEGAFAEFETLEQDAAVRIHVDGLTVCMAIYGSFASADAAFDPTKNTLALAIKLDDDIKYALVNVTPTIVTDDTATKVRITVVADETTPRPYEVIYGERVFEVQGYNLIMTDTGAAVELVAENGTVFPCSVVEAVSKQKLRVKSATLLEAGDYKLYVKSRGGDAEGTLQSPFRKVKYIHIEPTTTITKVLQEGRADDTVLHSRTSPCVVHGTGLALGAADKVLIELYKEGVCADEGDLTTAGKVTSSSDTAINLSGFDWNNRTVPDGDWWDAYPDSKLIVVKNGVRYEHPITFKGE